MFKNNYSLRKEVMKIVEDRIEQQQLVLDQEIKDIDSEAERKKELAVKDNIAKVFSVLQTMPQQ